MANATFVALAQFTASKVGKVGLADVTVDVVEHNPATATDNTTFLVAQAATEVLHGLYRYYFTGDEDRLYSCMFVTADATVDAKEVPALAVLLARLGSLDTDVSSRLATAGYAAPDNASIASILSGLGDVPTNAELTAALASADDAVLAAIAALNNLSSAGAQAAAAAALAAYGTALEATAQSIKAKTDNLPASPAAVGSAMTLTAAYDAAKTAASQASVNDVPTVAEFEARTLVAADYVVVTDTIAGTTTVGSVTGSVGSVTGAVGSVTGNVGGNVAGSVASVTAGVTLADDAITAAKFDESTAFPLKSADTGATAVARTGADADTLETLSDQVDGIAASAIADAVWDEALAGHAGVGSTGAALSAAGGSGDPWSTAVPGAYGAGTAGYILGTTVPAILEDTGTTLDGKLNTIDAIKAKTDNLPAQPAATGSAMTLTAAYDAAKTAASQASVNDVPTVAEFEARTLPAADYVVTGDLPSVPSAADIKTALEADGGKLDHLWEMTEDDGGVRRLTANALEEAPSGGLNAQEVRDAMKLAPSAGAAAAGSVDAHLDTLVANGPGGGAITWVYTLTNAVGGGAIPDAEVWVTSDVGGTTVLASGRTNASGQVTFYLDAGTVYVWRRKAGWNFTNPDTETVS